LKRSGILNEEQTLFGSGAGVEEIQAPVLTPHNEFEIASNALTHTAL
jgi:hypothetical protein